MKRKLRRLSEQGELTFHIYEDEDSLPQALEEFIELEAKGWKGKAGTALKCSAQTSAFARAVFAKSDRHTRTRIDMLRLDGRPISVNITVISGDTAWYLKPTYDERFGKFSPGLLAEIEHLKSVLNDGKIKYFDSACVPGHSIEKIWTGRKQVGDILFAARAGQNEAFLAKLARAEDWRHKARLGVKKLRDRIMSLGK